MLMYGIPTHETRQAPVVSGASGDDGGHKFVCNAHVGENVEPQYLQQEFDAVVLCTGATAPRDLAVEGRQLRGVHFAMDFLTGATKACLAGDADATPIHARGKDVVVIGGGDTGTDCVGTDAPGLGAFADRDPAEAAEERGEDNPCPN
jgi:glutamate synthase (NADPH/NADH) small chain